MVPRLDTPEAVVSRTLSPDRRDTPFLSCRSACAARPLPSQLHTLYIVRRSFYVRHLPATTPVRVEIGKVALRMLACDIGSTKPSISHLPHPELMITG